MQLKNLGCIQRQDEVVKNRLSLTYQKATAHKDTNDPFASKGNFAKNLDVINEGGEEEFSLAKELGMSTEGFGISNQENEESDDNKDNNGGLAGELNEVEQPQNTDKIRTSDVFDNKDYFKNKVMEDLDETEQPKRNLPQENISEEIKTTTENLLSKPSPFSNEIPEPKEEPKVEKPIVKANEEVVQPISKAEEDTDKNIIKNDEEVNIGISSEIKSKPEESINKPEKTNEEPIIEKKENVEEVINKNEENVKQIVKEEKKDIGQPIKKQEEDAEQLIKKKEENVDT